MTKHLRLIMLSLLAMICLGGYSQSETDFTKVSWKSPYTFGNYTMTAAKGKGTADPVQNSTSKDIRCYAKNTLTISTKEGKLVKIVFVISSNGQKQCAKPSVDNGSVTKNPTEGTIKEVIWENSEGSTSVTFTIGDKADWGTKPSKAGQLCFDKIIITDNSSKTPTEVKFSDLTNKNVILVNGKLEDGKEFLGYTAAETKNIEGTFAYAASGDRVATVDGTSGAVTVDPNVFGTTTITATFTPKDTKTYATSSASYTVNNFIKVYTSIADLKKDITIKESTFALNLTNAIVTYTNKNNAFIQDESAGILIYMNNHGLNAGDTFTGIVIVKAKLYYDLAEITDWASKVEPTQSKVPEPVVVTLAELTGDNYSKYESVRCKVVGVTVTKGMKDQDGEISQNGTIMPVRGGVKSLTMNEGAILDMIGYPSIFNVTKQFQVWKNSDMTEHQTVKEIILDENSDNIVEEAKNVNVTLKRTLVGDGDWNTLCVPFSLTEAQTKAAFGADVELRELESVAGNTLTFKKVNSVTADVPCLIKLSEAYAKDTYTFTGVNTVAAKVDDFGSDKVNAAISFIGIYSSKDVTEWATEGKDYVAYLGANNTFFKAKAGTKMKAFRAFFVIPENTPTSAVKAVIDGNATGIEDLVIDGVKANGRVYNLNGQYVGNSLNGLQSGIYIQNGKKIVIK